MAAMDDRITTYKEARSAEGRAGLFLRGNGYRLIASNADLVTVTMRIAQSQASLTEITAWLRENSQPVK